MATTSTRSARPAWRPRNAAHWKVIRQCARIARSENVEVTLLPDGTIKYRPLRPLDDSTAASGDRRCAPERTKEKKHNGSSNSSRTATAGESARERREQRSASRQRDAQARVEAQAAPPPAAAPPQPEPPMPAAFGALSFEPMVLEPNYEALWQRFNSFMSWRVRNERMLQVVREHRLAPDAEEMPLSIPLAPEPAATRSPGEAGLTTPSPSRGRRKSRRGR